MTIKDHISTLIEKIENTKISFWGGVSLLYGIIFIRTFIENWANSLNLYHMSNIGDTFFHYPFFYIIIFLSCFIIAKIITKEKIEKIAKVVIFLSFVITFPPIIDLLLNWGGQIPYIFITGSYSELLNSFLTYLGGGAIGIGIKTEVAIALIGFGFYLFYKTKNIKNVILGIFFLYSVIFTTLASPTLIFGLQNIFTNKYESVTYDNTVDFYYFREALDSKTSQRTLITNISEENNFYSPLTQKVQNQYSTTLAIIFVIISMILLFWCLFLYSSKKFFLVFQNFRYLRIIYYFIFILFGIYLGSIMVGRHPLGSLFDLISIISVFLALLFAWLFSVWENDEVDIDIDKISNQNRPLAVEETLSKEEWRDLKYIFLAYSLSFAFLSGFYTFIFTALFILVYHFYSAPPLRLKRFLGISSLLIAANALIATWMGFFIASGTENLSAFPARYTFGILAIFLLAENVKNIKDIEGDKKEGIKTLPVILGEKWGKPVVGACLFLASLLTPVIFYLSFYTFLAGIFFGIILFLLTNRKNFNEKYIFLAYFVYILLFVVLINL